MSADRNSFDRLVAGLSPDERGLLLKKLKANIEPEKESLEFEVPEDSSSIVDLKKELKNEPLLLRVWIYIRGLFSPSGIEGAYSDYRIGCVLKKINNAYPNVIDARYLTLENTFYDHLVKLQEAALFFNDGIKVYDRDEGGFCILLTELVMPDFAERMENEVSPYSLSPSAEATPELRTSLLRKMEQILADMDVAEKEKLQDCFSSLEWLKQFATLPFAHFMSLFRNVPERGMCCSLKAAQNEIERFARVLCNAKKIVPEVLEALYMFASEDKMNEGEKVDIEGGLAEFLRKSMQHTTLIKYVIRSVPFRSLGVVALDSALWVPEYKEASDNWLLLCKNQWRKVFDEEWTRWIRERKIQKTKENVAALFGMNDYPAVPNRPWEKLPFPADFKRGFSLGFLSAFFSVMYPDFRSVLEKVAVNGKFILPENRIEFTDTYNEMNQLADLLAAFNEKLGPTGFYGQGFASVSDVQNIPEREKVKNLTRSIESEINLFVATFSTCCRSFKQLFDGMLVDIRSIKYDGLSNLASLTDANDMPLRPKLAEVSDKLNAAFTLLTEVESLELDLA